MGGHWFSKLPVTLIAICLISMVVVYFIELADSKVDILSGKPEPKTEVVARGDDVLIEWTYYKRKECSGTGRVTMTTVPPEWDLAKQNNIGYIDEFPEFNFTTYRVSEFTIAWAPTDETSISDRVAQPIGVDNDNDGIDDGLPVKRRTIPYRTPNTIPLGFYTLSVMLRYECSWVSDNIQHFDNIVKFEVTDG